MKCCISHTTALRWLARNANPRLGSQRASRIALASMSTPNKEQALKIKRCLGMDESAVLDVLTSPSARRVTEGVLRHSYVAEPPSGSFLALPAAIAEMELYVVVPELAFVQYAHCHETLDAIYCGMSLCSSYRINPAVAGGVSLRQADDGPLTTKAKLAGYLERLDSLHGCSRAAKALPHLVEHSYSPKESGLAMSLGLPLRFGGFNLGAIALNEPLEIRENKDLGGNPRVTIRRPDILITNTDRHGRRRTVALDYDGFAFHTDPHALSRDLRRRNDIATVTDLAHFALTTDEISDFYYVSVLADRIRRALGQRKQPQPKGNPDAPENRLRQEQTWQRQFDLWARYVNRHQEL